MRLSFAFPAVRKISSSFKIAEFIIFMASLGSGRNPNFAAKPSAENLFSTSVAVVITGFALIAAATFRVNSFAPPTCPLNRLITFCPRSSITITAGSLNLLTTCGAITLTAIPAAQINISASNFLKMSATKFFMPVKFLPLQKISPPICSEIFFASLKPASVTDKIAIRIFSPKITQNQFRTFQDEFFSLYRLRIFFYNLRENIFAVRLHILKIRFARFIYRQHYFLFLHS